ncbi:hypothetical protein [uncultured Brevundimonas sp.]|uniref:hypothetical protein n=1 Tax=uncultured Brevundimonas sp. TaxID=213418 RepID=UPI0025F47643|nr:hypothetical protein [uncultured Brevundimonas sp.]
MKAHPRTTYVTAGAEAWSLIRGAYLSGLSAPTVAARFGVSVSALRKRARREGWTKQQYAAARALPDGAAPLPVGQVASAAAPPSAMLPGGGHPILSGGLSEDEVVEVQLPNPTIQPGALARRALAHAAQAVRDGQGLNAVRLARAAAEIARLDQLLEWDGDTDDEGPEAEARFRGRQDIMRVFIREQALDLARRMTDGRPLPPAYVELEAMLARQAAMRDGEGAS